MKPDEAANPEASGTLPSASKRREKVLIVIVALPIFLVVLSWTLLKHASHRKIKRVVFGANFDQVDWAVPRRAQLREPSPSEMPPRTPASSDLRAWLGERLGRPAPWYIPIGFIRKLWLEQPLDHWLWVLDSKSLFFVVDVAAHTPPQHPFESDHTGLHFVYLTNRKGSGLSRIINPIEPNRVLDLPIAMGYTSLWHMEWVSAFPADSPHPNCLPAIDPKAIQTDPNRRPREWVVFRDPHYSKSNDPSSRDTLISTHEDRASAELAARKYTERYVISTIVARLIAAHEWH